MGHPLDMAFVDTVTVGEINQDEEGEPTIGSQREVSCRYERNAHRIYNENGEEVDRRDQLATGKPVFEGEYVWPPGADDSKIADASQVTEVHRASFLGQSNVDFFEVVL